MNEDFYKCSACGSTVGDPVVIDNKPMCRNCHLLALSNEHYAINDLIEEKKKEIKELRKQMKKIDAKYRYIVNHQ